MTLLDNIRIVLVETSHPGNIGGAARAMKTMGLSSLWLVRPERYPDPQAEWRAAGALDVLEGARVCVSVDEAIGDCQLVLGTSTRVRRVPWPLLTAREAAPRVLDEPPGHAIAILFGCETSGLANEDLQRCHLHVQIPADPEYASLNLAMAVQIIGYELYQATLARHEALPVTAWDRPPATSSELESFYQHLDQVLGEVDFYDPDNPRQALTRFRRLFTRVRPDVTEVKMLRGLLRQVQWRIAQAAAAHDDENSGHR